MVKKMLVLVPLILLSSAAAFFYDSYAFDQYISKTIGSDMNIPINQHAPVKASDTIEILAPIEIVWGVLTQIEAWPSWQKAVTEARMEAPLQEGTPFKWKAGGLSFRSKIHTMQAQTQFGWTGKTIGANAIHNWSFQDKNGTTTVKVEESLQGIFPKLFKTYFQTSLEKGIKINLEELKQEAEIKAGK